MVLSASFVVLAGLGLLVPRSVQAAAYGTAVEALTACQALAADRSTLPGYQSLHDCDLGADAQGVQAYLFQMKYWNGSSTATTGITYYTFDGPPANPCGGMASANIYQEGKILAGSSVCVRGPAQANGAQAMCGVTLTPISPPVYNPWSGGHWQTYTAFVPTGQACGEGSGDQAGLIEGPDGNPVPDAPPIPDPVPPTDPDPPKVCGGVSCYDPGADQYCAGTEGGGQVCVPGSSGRDPAGSCATSGSSTLCAGSPQAPAPPAGDVPNPPGQTQGSDTTTQANPTTGQSIPVGTTTYGNPGAPPISGQGSGDSGPSQSGGGTGGDDGGGGDPAGSSSASNPGSYSGGGDCNNPPACSGDAVACGASRTQWATTCLLHKDLAGTGDGQAALDALKGKYTQADVWSEAGGSGSTVGDQANAGSYDTAGFGFSTQCPMTNLSIPLWEGKSIDLPLEKGCIIGPWIRGIVLAFALFAAARITAGSNS